MTGTSLSPYVSTSRPIEELVDPEVREFRIAYDRMMAKLHAMTPEERLEYWIRIGACHPDGTPKLPEGEPIGMPYPGDYDNSDGTPKWPEGESLGMACP